jgi:chemotaxis protein MotA
LLGIGIAVVYVLLVLFMRGGNAWALFDLHAALMVLGGTFAAVAVTYPMATFMRIPRLILLAGVGTMLDLPTVAAQLIKAADRVRMGGRTSAPGSARDVDDPFMRTGLGWVAEGFDPAEIRQLLEAELTAIRARHRGNFTIFESLGGYAPTFGILGTVEAMVQILGNLTTPEKLGPEIGLAMVATLYGVGFANLVFLPLGNRLKKLSEEELRVRQLMVDVIVAIQEGAKPEWIRERLRVSLPPDLRRSIAVKSRVKAKRAPNQTAPLNPPPMEDEMYATVPEEQY